MKEFFEYFYFRFAQKNYKRDGSLASTALIAISITQLLILYNIIFFFREFINPEIRKLYLYEKIIFGLLFVVINYINYKLYNKKYFEFRERWKDETVKQRKFKYFLIILFIVFSWCLIFVNGCIFDRFKSY